VAGYVTSPKFQTRFIIKRYTVCFPSIDLGWAHNQAGFVNTFAAQLLVNYFNMALGVPIPFVGAQS